MKKLCLVTYMRSDERFTEELKEIADAFYDLYNRYFKVIICCEKKIEIGVLPYDVIFFEKSGTKYRRLISMMEVDDSDYYISIDNDITGHISDLIAFTKEVIDGEYEVGWGRIRAKKQKGFIANMVGIDKLLSHNIIRPLLWKSGKGISIPGQIFCIRGEAFRGKLIDLDTFLDDLALGLYVNVHHSKKYITNKVLGEENPNGTFEGLLKQRTRWAKGYYTIISSTKSNLDYRERVLIHGFSYHFTWIINWIIIIGLLFACPPLAIVYVMIVVGMIVGTDIDMFFYALVYQFVFPVFHLKWGITVISELVRGKKNGKES